MFRFFSLDQYGVENGGNALNENVKNLRRITTVFLALGWIFSNQYLAWKACFDFHHTSPPFQPMIKFYVLVGFQPTAVTIATVTQSTSFWITSIISKSSQTLSNESFRIETTQSRQLVSEIRKKYFIFK